MEGSRPEGGSFFVWMQAVDNADVSRGVPEQVAYRVVYVSSAVRLFGDAELREVLAVSRRNNTAAGITGLLLYRGGNFIQTLEGTRPAVEDALERIGRDQRHRGIIVVLREAAPVRQFAGWSMGFENLDGVDLAALPGYSSFLDQETDLLERPETAVRLMQLFRSANR